ncbi:MAG: hypothetical protein ACRBF0_07270 [Calditrichia bacterium]
MIRYEIGPWGLLILLFATTLAGNNNYHVWYTNIFIVCFYLFIVFQVVKTNRRLLIQMRYLPTFQQQFRKIAAAFSFAILFYLILIFTLADATIDFNSVVYILQFFAFSFAAILSFLDKSLKNLLLGLFIAFSFFFEPSPLSFVAVLVAFLPFSKLWSSTGSVKQMTRLDPGRVGKASTSGVLLQDQFILQFLRLKYQRVDQVRSSITWLFAALAIPFLYAAQAIVQHQDAAIFQFFVFMQCLILIGGYFYLLLVGTDLIEILSFNGRLTEFHTQLRQSAFTALLIPASAIAMFLLWFAGDNFRITEFTLSLLSGLAFLDAAMLMLAVSPLRKRFLPLWLLAAIVLLLCEPYQQAILVMPVYVLGRILYAGTFDKWSRYAEAK